MTPADRLLAQLNRAWEQREVDHTYHAALRERYDPAFQRALRRTPTYTSPQESDYASLVSSGVRRGGADRDRLGRVAGRKVMSGDLIAGIVVPVTVLIICVSVLVGLWMTIKADERNHR